MKQGISIGRVMTRLRRLVYIGEISVVVRYWWWGEGGSGDGGVDE